MFINFRNVVNKVMEQSLTELFDSLVALSVWLDNEVENTSQDFTSQLRSRLDEIKKLRERVFIENQKMS
jgi:hypothetical protein